MALEALRLVWDFAITSLPLDLHWTEYFLLFFGASVVPALAMQQQVSPEGMRRTARLCEAMGAAGMILVLAAVAVELVNGLSGSFRLSTEILNPISLGHLAVSLVIVSAYCMIVDRNRRSGARAAGLMVLRAILILVSLAVLFATGSKGPLVALLIVGACAAAMVAVQSPKMLSIVALGVALLAISAVVALNFGLPGIDRLLAFGSDQSGLERMQLIRGALSQFEESPLAGSAVVEYFRRLYPHNVLIDSMMSLGIFGAALFVCTAAAAFARAVLSLRQSTAVNIWVVLLFVQYMVDSMFSGALALSPQMWVCMAIVWVLPGKSVNVQSRE
jgi:O-antigen ligase